MKTITLKSRWVDQIDSVTKEEYPAGWSGDVTSDRAARAKAAGVLAPAPAKPAKSQD